MFVSSRIVQRIVTVFKRQQNSKYWWEKQHPLVVYACEYKYNKVSYFLYIYLYIYIYICINKVYMNVLYIVCIIYRAWQVNTSITCLIQIEVLTHIVFFFLLLKGMAHRMSTFISKKFFPLTLHSMTV